MSARTTSRARRGASAAAAATLAAALTVVAIGPASAVPGLGSVDSAPSGLSNDDTPTFSGTAEGLPGEPVDVVIDGITYSAFLDDALRWHLNAPPLPDGTHEYVVQYSAEPIGQGEFTTDTTVDIFVTPPQFELPVRHTTATSLTFGVSSEPGATITYSLDADQPVTVSGGTVELTGLSAGYHDIEFWVVDAVGNSNGASWDWTVVAAPVVSPSVLATHTISATVREQTTIDLDDLVTAGTNPVTSVEAWTPFGTELFFRFDMDSHVVTLEPSEAGTFTFTYAAGTDEGEQSNDGIVTVEVAPEPTVSASWLDKPDASTTSTTAHFSVASDSGATLGYVLDLPDGAQSVSPVEVDGTQFTLTGLSVGRHTIRVAAIVNGHTSAALEYTWEVVATPGAPIVQPPAAPPVVAPVLSVDAIPAAQIRQGIQRGALGASVAIIQHVVGTTEDGIFGPATRAAVVAFQRNHGLVTDGIVGPLTWGAIVQVANGGTGVHPVSVSMVSMAVIKRGVTSGARGQTVVTIQQVVGATPDGIFGPRTKFSVKTFQRGHGLVADGIVGPLTWLQIVAASGL